MKHNSGAFDAMNSTTTSSSSEPAAERGEGSHYRPPICIGPIPGLSMPPKPPSPSPPTFEQEYAAAVAAEAAFGASQEPDEDPSNGPATVDDLADQGITQGEPYIGPEKLPVPLPKAARPTAMVSDSSKTPKDIWDEICSTAKTIRVALSPRDAKDLWMVYCGRKGELMLLVASEPELHPYLDGMKPCPVTISGASSYITLHGEAQSLAGWDRHGAAADEIDRLAFIRKLPFSLSQDDNPVSN